MNKIRRFPQLAALTAFTVSVIGLSGCASFSQEEIDEAAARVSVYDSTHSYAWNLTKQMGIDWYLKDARLDEDGIRKHAQSETAGNCRMATDIPPEKNLSTMTLSLVSPGGRVSFAKKPVYLGYLPKDAAPDAQTAFDRFFTNILGAAYEKTAEEMGYEVQKRGAEMRFHRPAADGRPEGIFLVRHFAVPSTRDTNLTGHEARIPGWISDRQERAWVMGGVPGSTVITILWTMRILQTGEEEDARKIEFMKRLPKYLPDRVFVYIPPMSNGRGGCTAPYVADNKGRHYFAMQKAVSQ